MRVFHAKYYSAVRRRKLPALFLNQTAARGVSLRVVIFCINKNPRYPGREPIPETILINPKITPLADDTTTDWEGCLSVPGLRGLVPRFQHIHYAGYDTMGRLFEHRVEGFHARVVQHEVDHLDGILYPQRMLDLKQLCFEQALFPYNLQVAQDEPNGS